MLAEYEQLKHKCAELEKRLHEFEKKASYYQKFAERMGVMRLRETEMLSHLLTEHKQSEEQLRFQAELLRQIQDSIVATDLEGRITYVNEAAARILKRDPAELIGSTVFSFGEDAAQGATQQEILDQTLANGVWQGTVVNYASDGIERVFETRTWLIRNAAGEPTGFLGISTNITERTHAEKEMRTILKTAHDGFSLADTHGRFLDVNDAYCRMLGYSREEFLNLTISDINATYQTQEDALKAIEQVMKIGNGLFESKLRRKDGQIIDVEISVNSVDISGGRLVAFVRDISARKRTESALQELHQIINSSPAVAFLWQAAPGWPVKFVSKNIAQFGYTPDDFYSGHIVFADIVYPDDLERVAAEVEEYTREGHTEFTQEYRIFTAAGEIRWLENRTWIRRNSDGTVTNYQGIVLDSTIRKQAEEDLRKAKELAETARKAAESANQAKSEFLARMSHEFKTPMNIIMGMTYVSLETELTSKQRKYLEDIQSASQTLLRLIDDILDFSGIETGKLTMESVNFQLDTVLEHLSGQIQENAQEKGLTLRCEIDHTIPSSLIGDPFRLRQILVNLMDNAVKFTETGEVICTVKLEQEPGHSNISDVSSERVKLLFSVSDTGIGIPPEKLSGLFTPFTQVDGSSTRKHGGTGLGLALCKRLVEMMDGQIWVESEPGQGSTFYFTVVFGRPPEERAKETKAPQAFRTSKHAEKDIEKRSENLYVDQDGLLVFSNVKPLLTELAVLLEEGDVEAVEYLETLKNYLSDSGIEGQITQLEEQINNYDFEDAQETLAEITTSLNISLEEKKNE